MSQSPQIQSRINTLAKELANGKERGEIVSKFSNKWQTNARTIDRYIKNAKIIATSLTKRASKAADDVYVEASKEAAKSAVMSRIERLETLTSIAKGEFLNEIKKPAWNNQNKKFEIITVNERPDHNGVIKAIGELNKMEGDYAAIKSEVTGANGTPLAAPQILILPPKEDFQIKEDE